MTRGQTITDKGPNDCDKGQTIVTRDQTIVTRDQTIVTRDQTIVTRDQTIWKALHSASVLFFYFYAEEVIFKRSLVTTAFNKDKGSGLGIFNTMSQNKSSL